MMHRFMSKVSPTLGSVSLLVLLSACASQYEAPIDDRSDALQRERALIVNSGETVDASLRRQSATIAQSNRSSSTSTPTNSSNAGSSSTNAAQSGEQVGATSTVVRAVSLGGGISRNTTRSAPSPASLENDATSTTSGISRQPLPSSGTPQSSAASSASISSTAGQIGGDQTPVQPSSSAVTAPSQQPSDTSAAVASGSSQHRVARGDTLYSIAWRHNMDVRSLALINGLSEPYTIYPGQVLQIQESGLPNERLETVPDIPVSPAGEEIAAGQRPQAAIDGRRVGSVNERDIEGVTWQWPSDGRLLSMFNTSGTTRGIDIAGTQGDSVYAAADGDVVYAGTGIQGAGNLVILRHSARHLSAYMHNRRLLVSEGDFVRGGDKIAEVGTGPDGRDLLHFEVRLDGKPVNPVRYLPNR